MSVDPGPLHILARTMIDDAKARVCVFDKKLTRYNDIVEVGLRYAACGSDEGDDERSARAGVYDAVMACIKTFGQTWRRDRATGLEFQGPRYTPNDASYVAGTPLREMVQAWMIMPENALRLGLQ